MNRGLYISATSLSTNQKKLEVLSNNLANVNTTGYKKDTSLTETFPEKLLMKINDKSKSRLSSRRNEIQLEPPTEEGVYKARTNNGYFIVNTPMGKSYVKDIRFIIDDEGYLRTHYKNDKGELKTDYENYITDSSGNPIQGQDGDLAGLLQGIVYNPPSYVIGTMNAGVKFQKIVTDFTPGNIFETGGTFDLALDGSGFFKVTGENGEDYYTRDGSFVVNQQGLLTTLRGEVVQGTNGPINIDGKNVSISNNGAITIDNNVVGNLAIVDLENKEFLRKVGDNLYQIAENVESEEIPFEGEVLQGYLEGSNVNAIREMVDMITLLREFEAGQKAIRVQDEMLDKASNEIGRV